MLAPCTFTAAGKGEECAHGVLAGALTLSFVCRLPFLALHRLLERRPEKALPPQGVPDHGQVVHHLRLLRHGLAWWDCRSACKPSDSVVDLKTNVDGNVSGIVYVTTITRM